MKESFRMPEVGVGQVVQWFPHGLRSQPPHPMLVCHVGAAAIRGRILGDTLELIEGVHHMDDPGTTDAVRQDCGGWDFTDQDKKLEDIKADVRDIKKRIAVLLDAKAGK